MGCSWSSCSRVSTAMHCATHVQHVDPAFAIRTDVVSAARHGSLICQGVARLFEVHTTMHCSQLSSKAHLTNVSAFKATSSSVTSRPVRVHVPVIENRVAIRFQRFGRHKAPFYRVVAVDSKQRRDYGEPLEYLGWYDPLKKETNLNGPSIRKWLTQGAQPSDTVRDLLKKAYIIEPTETKYDKRKTRAFRTSQEEPAAVAAE